MLSTVGSGRRHYLDYLADSARWDAFDRRPDDIVISTPAKCGTTWTQAIVAMLVLGTAALPAPLATLSPWVDMQVRTSSRELHRIWMGRTTIPEAIAAGTFEIDGPPALVRAFPRWFSFSPFASSVRRALQPAS